MAQTADYMARYANHHCCNIAIVFGGHTWLSTEHLKMCPHLSRKLAAQYIGRFSGYLHYWSCLLLAIATRGLGHP